MSGIHGQLLEVTVVGCSKLKDTEWISRQDPYVGLEYGSSKFRTRTHTDGGKNPVFQEKFVFTLIEGLRELNAIVWNSNTVTYDDFIGSGKIQLQKVLSQGFDDSSWPLQTKNGRHAGEVRLIMHFQNNNRPATSYGQSAPPYGAPSHPPHISHYSAPPPVSSYPPISSYPPVSSYPPGSSPYPSYPPNPSAYPPTSYYPPQPSGYPSPYGQPSPYAPPPNPYPAPPPHDSYYHPPSPYHGAYPPRPY